MLASERNMTSRFVAVWMAAGLGVVAAGCGSSSTSPTGASQATAGAPAAVAGATIRGTVQTGVAASSTGAVRALAVAGGVRVSVVGTSLVTQTDSAGQFELQGLPAGRVRLRFEAPGIQAELEIQGLEDGHAMNVEVHFSGDGAFLSDTDDHRNEASLRGRIDAINGSRLQVQGRVVQTDGLTQFLGHGDQPTSLGALKVGDNVEIEGASQGDGSVYARKVKLEDANGNEPPQHENEVQFSGGIQSLNPFKVAGRVVMVDSHTQILDHRNAAVPFSALKVGDTVEVEGVGRSDGSVLATKVKLEN
jgi:hypothetical protein